MTLNNQISDTLKNLPDKPGVYLMSDASGTVIYVGKAKILKNRVRSYFHSNNLPLKTQKLVDTVEHLEYVVTENELEALLLENNLIKKYKPKYNILLKDDKGYPYLKIDTTQPFPRLELARKMKFDGAQYFGPFHGAGSARAISDIALEIYPLRTCQLDLSRKKNYRACLKYHIDRCSGPCVNFDRDLYNKNVSGIISFLRGNQMNILESLEQKMQAASQRMEYERAAELRDKLKSAREILSAQKIMFDTNENIDVLGVQLKDAYAVICAVFVRSGRITGVTVTEYPDVEYSGESEVLSKFIMQSYSQTAVMPREIVCSHMPEDKDILEQILRESAGKTIKITCPSRGKKRDLYLMADKNALERIEKSAARRAHSDSRIASGLVQLQTALSLSKPPERLECFDISHIQGTDTVASMVVFTNGNPDKKEYRRFKIKTVTGNNDFASMNEVVTRRYSHANAGDKGFNRLPDLIIIDGGKGQLHFACEAMSSLGLDGIPIIGLAKRIEEIFLPHRSIPILLPYNSPALQILQSIRDEAHRFAITYHRSLRRRHMVFSELDKIPDIGKARKKALIDAFSTLSRIKLASVDDLSKVQGISKKTATEIFNYFHK